MGQTTYKQMYVSDIASIAASSSHTTPSDAFDVDDVETIAVQVKSTGANASISGNLTVNLVASVDGTNFDTQVFATVVLVQSDSSEERATELVNVRGLSKIRVNSIENADATYAATNVNVYCGKTIV